MRSPVVRRSGGQRSLDGSDENGAIEAEGFQQGSHGGRDRGRDGYAQDWAKRGDNEK